MPYSEFHACRSNAGDTETITLLDTDGSTLYETDYGGLLLQIIKLDDVITLSRYIARYPQAALAPGEVEYYDPFWVAAAHGSTDALRVLLEHYTIDPTRTQPLDERGFLLLNAACRQPPLGMVHARDRHGETALLSAAASLACLSSDVEDRSQDSCDYIRDRVARGEELMHLILDRGASARDAIIIPAQRDDNWWCFYWNVEGIKVLLDRGVNVADWVALRDSIGRLPLHWAAAGPSLCGEFRFQDDTVLRIVNIFNPLLVSDPSTINVQDKQGATALHYAVGSHAAYGSQHSDHAVRFLCRNGADASLQDSNGQTVLHISALRSVDSEPIDTALLDLLVAHGANITTTDTNGNTTLHIMARNLRQVQTVQFLLSRGADVNARNSQGNTPLHEAMRGTLRPRENREGKIEEVTLTGSHKSAGCNDSSPSGSCGQSHSRLDGPAERRWGVTATDT
ncbi:hypothetical protein SI65_09942 [Aspergillus cristatus]|uniref:Uncharacterized protein n=1 Tax=Aspergillus cristatus TaxID=573508 RepID=A0A1E3B101_ASPCR|nr:hypothetical protein SI65_09942 [Aspergillus cristatus]